MCMKIVMGTFKKFATDAEYSKSDNSKKFSGQAQLPAPCQIRVWKLLKSHSERNVFWALLSNPKRVFVLL